MVCSAAHQCAPRRAEDAIYLQCFAECQPSALCPVDGADATAPPSSSAPRGPFAFVMVIARSEEGATEQPPAEAAAWRKRYVHSGLRLALSLRDTETRHPIVLLHQNLAAAGVAAFKRQRVVVRRLPRLPLSHLPTTNRVGTFYKLAAWSLTKYARIVVLDTDCIVRANLDHLFDPGVSLPAAVHAPVLGAFGVITSPDRTLRVMPFNSGMMVIAQEADWASRPVELRRR